MGPSRRQEEGRPRYRVGAEGADRLMSADVTAGASCNRSHQRGVRRNTGITPLTRPPHRQLLISNTRLSVFKVARLDQKGQANRTQSPADTYAPSVRGHAWPAAGWATRPSPGGGSSALR